MLQLPRLPEEERQVSIPLFWSDPLLNLIRLARQPRSKQKIATRVTSPRLVSCAGSTRMQQNTKGSGISRSSLRTRSCRSQDILWFRRIYLRRDAYGFWREYLFRRDGRISGLLWRQIQHHDDWHSNESSTIFRRKSNENHLRNLPHYRCSIWTDGWDPTVPSRGRCRSWILTDLKTTSTAVRAMFDWYWHLHLRATSASWYKYYCSCL